MIEHRKAFTTKTFSPYIEKRLHEIASRKEDDGCLAYYAAIGEEECPVVFTADSHLMRRASERIGISYAELIIEAVLKAIEKTPELGEIILNAIDKACDEDRTHAVVALWIESEDFFTYLYCNEETIHITTVVCGAPIYYVNDMADAICWLTAQGNIISGISNIPKFRISTNTKYQNGFK